MTQDTLSGVRSEELRRALDDAAARRPARLWELLARFGGQPGPRPNLALAQAVGDAIAERPAREAAMLLAPLAADESAPDTAQVYLPMVAAWGYVALIRARKTEDEAWTGLAPIAADERAPIRLATAHALASLCARDSRGGDVLVHAMRAWVGLDGAEGLEDREVRWGALATALDAIAERGALTSVKDRAALLEVTSAWITELAEAPRAAERSEGRRRSLASLAVGAALFARDIRGAADGASWLEQECARARHPDLRKTFQLSLDRLGKRGSSERGAVLETLARALASSAKPPRDPTADRKGTRRRGQ